MRHHNNAWFIAPKRDFISVTLGLKHKYGKKELVSHDFSLHFCVKERKPQPASYSRKL